MVNFLLPTTRDRLVRATGLAICEHRLLRHGDSVLMALSGGADSVALAIVLRALAEEFGLVLRAAHVNHGLRGMEADEDARWVRNFAETLGIPLDVACVDVLARREAEGGSLEEVARIARYEQLYRLMREHAMRTLATAHHRDDQAETVLLNLLRGAGITGLGGMQWRTEAGHIRPFLGISRQEILEALGRWGASWRVDSSNASPMMARNRVRHSLIPLLRAEFNPGVSKALARLADVATAEDSALEEWAQDAADSAVVRKSAERVILDVSRVWAYPLGLRRRVLRRVFVGLRTVEYPLGYEETMALDRLCTRQARVSFRERFRAWSTRRYLVGESYDAWQGPTDLRIEEKTEIPGWGRFAVYSLDATSADWECGTGFERAVFQGPVFPPLLARRWKPGDRILSGRSGRLVADLLKEKARGSDPRIAVVVCDQEGIVWVPDLLMHRECPVADAKRFKIEWESA